tara:strand:- start:485 stop:682 length:198 start_codon:yes stop_codon:yes gene_type:complete
MNTLYALVISIWGLTAEGDWLYVGNQLVYKEPMQKEECFEMINKWDSFHDNEYYSFSIECHEKKD